MKDLPQTLDPSNEVTPPECRNATPKPFAVTPEVRRAAALLRRCDELRTFIRAIPIYTYSPVRHFDHAGSCPASRDTVAHALYVIEEARRLVAEGNLDKAFRWLGFAQGALWAAGIYSINELQALGSAS